MLRTPISTGNTIPTLPFWINPVYEGIISRFDKDELDLDVNLPECWMDDFPNHNYKYTHLTKLISTLVDGSPIHKPTGYQTAEKFDATWLDFYQLFSDELSKFGIKKSNSQKKQKDDQKEQKEQKEQKDVKKRKPGLTRYMRVTEGKILNSIHINCEPAVLASLNHYIRTQFRHPWEWLITNTIKEKTYINMPPKADDPFDEHPKQRGLYYGVDGDGDFTSLNNIRSLDFPANLFTSCITNTTNASVQILGSIICMCYTLQKEGSAILQLDLQNCTFIVNVLHLLSCIFQTAEIIQLRRFYFHGIGFKGLAKTYLAKLTKLLPYYRDLQDTVPALFERDAIPSSIISSLGMAFSRSYDSSTEQKIEIYELQPHHRIFEFHKITQ
jgi:hypothetical protein